MMKTKNILSSAMLCLTIAVGITSCDGHIEEADTSIKIGHILCTDGTVIPQDKVEQLGKNPIAVVFYINDEESNKLSDGTGLAAYLWDVKQQAFSDTIGVAQGTSADFDAYDGNSNTYAIYSNQNAISPMANTVFDLWHNGRSCYVPSVAEMRLMYSARSIIDQASTDFGGTPLSVDDNEAFYWTSTEVSGQESAKAWVYSLNSGAVQEAPKTQAYKIRPIITLFK